MFDSDDDEEGEEKDENHEGEPSNKGWGQRQSVDADSAVASKRMKLAQAQRSPQQLFRFQPPYEQERGRREAPQQQPHPRWGQCNERPGHTQPSQKSKTFAARGRHSWPKIIAPKVCVRVCVCVCVCSDLCTACRALVLWSGQCSSRLLCFSSTPVVWSPSWRQTAWTTQTCATTSTTAKAIFINLKHY